MQRSAVAMRTALGFVVAGGVSSCAVLSGLTELEKVDCVDCQEAGIDAAGDAANDSPTGCKADKDCTALANPRCDTATHTCVPCLPQNDNCSPGTRCVLRDGAYSCVRRCTTAADCGGDGGTVACCDNTCVDTASDTVHCGACGNACGVGQSCCASACRNTATDPDYCGGCFKSCSGNHVQSRTCAGGVCSGACVSPWIDCNGDKLTDGCEVDLTSDPDHCGACPNQCSPNNIASGQRTCTTSVCSGACAADFGDCNGNKLADGCETDLRTIAHCGACNKACSANHVTAQCNPTTKACDGACQTGWTDCNGDKQIDGCEKNTDADPDNCGTCGTVCSGNNLATRSCGGSPPKCNGACAAAYLDCNSDKLTDGCETPRTNSNCATCGNVCTAGQRSCLAVNGAYSCVGYTETTTTQPFIDACSLPGMTRYLVSQDDEATAMLPMPFTFSFYGVVRPSFFVSSNGVLGFNVPVTSFYFYCLPNVNDPKSVILAFAADLATGPEGVCVGTTGAAPDRKLVATWKAAKLRVATGNVQTFSVILSEAGGAIDIVYQTMTGDANATGAIAVIGVQNGDASLGTQHGCKTAGIATSGTAIRFAP